MRLATTDAEAAADFVLVGALSFGPFPAGDENIVQVRTADDRRRSPREPLRRQHGLRDRKPARFVGTRDALLRSNPKIDPAPPAEFFEHVG
jgi:hypothetical protein